jgi:hypothetical protein
VSTKKTTKAKSEGKTAAKASKTPKRKATRTEATPKKLSAIDAAAQILRASNQPMNAKELIEAMTSQGLWTSPGGKTPHATLYSAILRELNAKGSDARFQKTERGKFAANG